MYALNNVGFHLPYQQPEYFLAVSVLRQPMALRLSHYSRAPYPLRSLTNLKKCGQRTDLDHSFGPNKII